MTPSGALAESKFLDQYVIGFTSRPAWARFQERKAWEHDYLVILADKLTRANALWLEEQLHIRIHQDKEHTAYLKYSLEKRDKPYRASYGGIAGSPDELSHSVYMTWWEPEADQAGNSN